MTSIIIKMKDVAQNEMTAKLTYIKDTATDAELRELASKIVALTTNTLISVTKSTTTDIN